MKMKLSEINELGLELYAYIRSHAGKLKLVEDISAHKCCCRILCSDPEVNRLSVKARNLVEIS
jgi:hypothetical protein